jgi:DNA-binding transcriptional ArsR family regulator
MTDAAGAVFGALADPTRRSLVRSVAQDGPVTATELADRLPISRQAVAKHLGALRDAGLLAGEKAGRETRYCLTPEPFDAAAAWMADVGDQWDRRLGALQRHLS